MEEEPHGSPPSEEAIVDLHYTARGVQVTDEMRETALHKLARLERIEPRTTRIDLEIIAEHHPKVDGTKRVEAVLHRPRKSFRAHAEAPDVPSAIDRVADKLERQVRDHQGKKRSRVRGRVAPEAQLSPAAADTSDE
jgi:ribosomal subunit interface protein